MAFNPTKPVNVIYTEVDRLVDLTDIAKSPLSEAHKIDLSYIILQKEDEFKSNLKV